MKTCLISLNSKYIHGSLAAWYLKAACGNDCGQVTVLEHTVNESFNDILTSIYLNKPDIAAFSCYIWNITHVLKLADSLKKLLPGSVIVLGGPEVSYDADQILKENRCVDFILSGEGEESFPKLLRLIMENSEDCSCKGDGSCVTREAGTESSAGFKEIEGLAWRQGDKIKVQHPAMIGELDSIPSPYTEDMLCTIKNRIVYFEASRGCPYSCSYCLSSTVKGTRFFSLERVFKELDKLVEAGAGQIKFVDRTFNCHKERAVSIIRYLIDKFGKTDCNFHFEVGADLFDDELLGILISAPKGLFQIEAGVQTVNEASLSAINRITNLDKLFSNLERLHDAGNIHVHADLIAGLPFEDISSFGNSFNMVYSARPNQLQLGFLKFLKGTVMRRDAEINGYQYNDFPPYEILSGTHIGFDDLILLKGVAELVEKFYNSARFEFSLKYTISTCFDSPFHFYEGFADYCKRKGYLNNPVGLRDLYAIFYDFASTCMGDEERAILQEFLRLDFLASDNSGTLPGFMDRRTSRTFNEKCFEFMKSPLFSELVPEAAEIPAKQVFKKIHFELFHMELPKAGFNKRLIAGYEPAAEYIYLFNYMSRDKVTGLYPFYRINGIQH